MPIEVICKILSNPLPHIGRRLALSYWQYWDAIRSTRWLSKGFAMRGS
jgi:hypothetical protein